MRLVIISLDAVFAADADYLLCKPSLGRLAQEGVFCDRVQTVYPSLTYPIHASLVTGCYPDRHGIGHNGPFHPELAPAMRPWYWEARDIRVDTLFTQAKKAGRDSAAILWPTTGKSRDIRWNFPEALALPGESQSLKIMRYGSTPWLVATEIKYGRRRLSTKQPHLDDFATLVAETLLERQYAPGEGLGKQKDVKPSKRQLNRHMPDLLALHLVDCDAMRHQYGVFSQQAREALDRQDERVGRLLYLLEQKKAMKDTIIAVVSDHGQADIRGSLPLDSWLVRNKVPARAQTLGLGAYLHLKRRDYQPVLAALTENKEELHLQHIYTREELRAMHAPEDILLAVEPEEGLVIVDDENEEKYGATHGFGPRHSASKVLLWLYGSMFMKGARLSACDIVDIAPTLAYAAGLSLPEAQGRVLEEIMEWTGPQAGWGKEE